MRARRVFLSSLMFFLVRALCVCVSFHRRTVYARVCLLYTRSLATPPSVILFKEDYGQKNRTREGSGIEKNKKIKTIAERALYASNVSIDLRRPPYTKGMKSLSRAFVLSVNKRFGKENTYTRARRTYIYIFSKAH